MLIDKQRLRALLPHGGSMCLLDGVKRWDAESILCVSKTHRDPNNPLRSRGRLAAVHGLEYGAQAAAVHGGLLRRAAGAPPTRGYLAAFKDARLLVARLDTIGSPLEISAARLTADVGDQIYTIRVSALGRLLVSGRVLVIVAPEKSG
ncbi:MAG: 3-hydroxylacyl-ACP dehydratase [Gammaproteobacteria bacterium]